VLRCDAHGNRACTSYRNLLGTPPPPPHTHSTHAHICSAGSPMLSRRALPSPTPSRLSGLKCRRKEQCSPPLLRRKELRSPPLLCRQGLSQCRLLRLSHSSRRLSPPCARPSLFPPSALVPLGKHRSFRLPAVPSRLRVGSAPTPISVAQQASLQTSRLSSLDCDESASNVEPLDLTPCAHVCRTYRTAAVQDM
jgi:hypothetical protein